MNQQYEAQKEDCLKCSHPGQTTHKHRSEMDVLKQRLIDRDLTIVQLEAQMAQNLPENYSQTQLSTLRSRCDHWQDKYERLLEAHKRIQRVNQGLEDKLLKLVDRAESEKAKLTADTSSLTTALTTAAQAINRLKQENERYRNDLNVAIQLLQCNPSQYGTHKLQTLPIELQQQAKSKMVVGDNQKSNTKSEMKVIKVPIPTFPPTAMVYALNKYEEKEPEEEKPVDVVSAAIMAAVLEERQKERISRHCPTCSCTNSTSITITNPGKEDVRNVFTSSRQSSLDKSNNNPNVEISDTNTRHKDVHVANKIDDIIDVGTQTLPSYIGESGKVTSTCIYCHSGKTSSSENIDSIGGHMITPSKGKKLLQRKSTDSPDRSSLIHKNHGHVQDHRSGAAACPWDWSLESQDSGSPSTPTSLTSASLSYESETSNFTSPQDSPGRILMPQDSILASDKYEDSRNTGSRHGKPSKYSNLMPTSTSTDLQKQCIDHLGYKSSFNVRSPNRSTRSQIVDVFTPPIHKSPPLPNSNRTRKDSNRSLIEGAKSVTLSADLGAVLSSTATASATETTL